MKIRSMISSADMTPKPIGTVLRVMVSKRTSAGVASGTPYTGYVGSYGRWSYDPVLRRWRPPGGNATSARAEQIRTARNADRYPTYERLDLSVHRQFRLRGLDGDAFVNVVNVFNNRNVLLYTFDTAETPPRVTGLSQLPFLPTLGARLAF